MLPYLNPSLNTALDGWGAKAIAQCKPTNAVADASVFLGELLREGLPHIVGSTLSGWREGTRQARKGAGSEYLNLEFGWKPIANDVRKFISAVANADRVLSQYERDAGNVVRRRMQFPEEVSRSFSKFSVGGSPYFGGSHSALLLGGSNPGGYGVKVDETITRRWFSGAFTYHLPSDYYERGSMSGYATRARKLLGLSLTPETVWNLSPWSWAVDWFSSAGAVVSNLSDWASDGLVMKYGYIMEHRVRNVTYSWVGPTGYKSSSNQPATVMMVSETKSRRRASPFGFGLTLGDLSSRQLAIISALGLSRS